MADLLEFLPAVRAGAKLPGGVYKSERHFLDFLVNGNSLWERSGKHHDMVSVFCREFAMEQTRRAVGRLLLNEEADFPDDRRALLICSECGDLGCGAISILVVKDRDCVVWKAFGYENTYDNHVKLSDYADVGPFAFDAAAYQALLSGAVKHLYQGGA